MRLILQLKLLHGFAVSAQMQITWSRVRHNLWQQFPRCMRAIKRRLLSPMHQTYIFPRIRFSFKISAHLGGERETNATPHSILSRRTRGSLCAAFAHMHVYIYICVMNYDKSARRGLEGGRARARARGNAQKPRRHMGRMHNFSGHLAVEKNELWLKF